MGPDSSAHSVKVSMAASPSHPEAYVRYGYKVGSAISLYSQSYVSIIVQKEDYCTLEYRNGDKSLLFSSSYSKRNPSFAAIHKTKCIPIDTSTQTPYLRCIPYIIKRKTPSRYLFSSVSSFHGNVQQQGDSHE